MERVNYYLFIVYFFRSASYVDPTNIRKLHKLTLKVDTAINGMFVNGKYSKFNLFTSEGPFTIQEFDTVQSYFHLQVSNESQDILKEEYLDMIRLAELSGKLFSYFFIF